MKYGGKEEIPPCESKCLCDDFENAIRKIGVEFACEWFGCSEDFTKETIKTLCERSGIEEPWTCNKCGENAHNCSGDCEDICPECSNLKEDCICLEPVLNKLDYEGKL